MMFVEPESMTASTRGGKPWQAHLIDQGWCNFTPEDHAVWDILFKRQVQLLRGRVVSSFLDGLDLLELNAPGVPELTRLNQRLLARTGWRCVSVAGLVPDEAFFAMLADRLFPIGNFVRTRVQLDYLEEPDCFHDIFGHVPMLAHTGMANAMQSIGDLGLRAIAAGLGHHVARLYWHTIEFGLCREADHVRILGAGLASSFGEARASLEDESIERRRFTVEEAIAASYRHDAMQPLYFVSDSLEAVVSALEGATVSHLTVPEPTSA
ncbi:phenylalanine 4-monooxygenase [Sphingomonas sp. BN140010]|uniref:Phenylalanine 4-monooxygenase n=1 Tax=Sphingomonas arvum TaxID=2992113 RepID=A0ABT3JCW3_9SPHN|nr:phenylalanine 4-monooxygenase [Sphingomonas sp. BN140010]MCW3796907.1 phenylalanine 4-monooxygenase [Sphingomonas sp. BN140010]